jgi:Cdc6-like AAA superfamily ATPase
LRKGDLDATGRADQLAIQIGSFLRNAQTAPPLTIAITGPWGSGKSSVLSRLRDELVAGVQRPVWFNAWHHQGEESMFAALMQAVRSEAVPSWWSLAGVDVRARLLLSRVRGNPAAWLLILTLIAGTMGFLAAARWPTPAESLAPLHALLKEDKLAEAGVKLLLALGWPLTISVALLIMIGALRDRLSSAGLDPGRLLAAAGRATHWRDLGVQLAFRDRFKQALSEVTAALGRRTLIILIDDLDRCRPDQIAEVFGGDQLSD